ncbi:MAG: sulfurtransferase TusA family protein [Methyloligellaceae bacterium]
MTVVDATELKCPLPVLKAQKALRGLEKGQEVLVMATDPNAPGDLEDLCGMTSDRVIENKAVNGVFHITIVKG